MCNYFYIALGLRSIWQPQTHLHWRITPRFFPFELPVADLWQRRQWLSLLNVPVPTLAPEDLLLSLCVHGAKECWGKLKWICDVAELIRTNPALY
ncbi:nucleotidyltransferase family protein [Nostoc sp. CHAB 5844]|nr:nucleotidyltransferase family protein [Nostoc sp. CHAB 5844]